MMSEESTDEFFPDAAEDEVVASAMRWRTEIAMRRRLGCFPFAPLRRFRSLRRGSVVVTSNIPVLKDLLNFERDLLLPHVAELLQGLYSVNDG